MENSYVTRAQQVVLTPDPTQVAVRFHEPAPHAMRLSVARSAGLLGSPAARYQIPGEKYTVLPVTAEKGADTATLEEVTRKLQLDDTVARVARVFLAGPNRLVATDRVVVRLERGARGGLHRMEARGYRVLHQRGFEYLLRLPSHENPLEVAGQLAQLSGVESAYPDFVEFGAVRAPGPSQPSAPAGTGDTWAASQWARYQTNADAALALLGGAGKAAIRIAIVDSGVDRLHPDLAPAIAGVFDAVDEPPKDNPQPEDYHGTACAGLAAAVPYNQQGIRGFGGGCSILAVRVMYTSGPQGAWNTAGFAIARGIDWAVSNGADVVSLSLNTYDPHPSVINAIERALAEGRGGKGCVVVSGTGNDNPDDAPGVKFPALLPGVVAVAATNERDEPIVVRSDGSGWNSAWGEQVAIAAPGERHWTTDNTALAGSKLLASPAGDYVDNFDGTSSSTAIVAGAAGLVLSANPDLDYQEVREILCSTARKAATVPYDAIGHSDRLGTGVLDLEAAVTKALER